MCEFVLPQLQFFLRAPRAGFQGFRATGLRSLCVDGAVLFPRLSFPGRFCFDPAVRRAVSVPADGVNGPAAVDYDLGYGARAAMVMQEYYNTFKTGLNPQTPGDNRQHQSPVLL